MVPPIITDKLAGLRRAEKTQRLAFGLGRLLAVVLVAVLLACFVDWLIDRFDETPLRVRATLLSLQLAVALVLLAFWVIVPLCRRLPDDDLALWVEERYPKLSHRLISAVQFNRPGGKRQGMSLELIQVVTREAETHAERLDFNRVVDKSRLPLGLAFFLPALLLFILALVLWPLLPTLLARQFLADIEIRALSHRREPRSLAQGQKLRLGSRRRPRRQRRPRRRAAHRLGPPDMDASWLPLKRAWKARTPSRRRSRRRRQLSQGLRRRRRMRHARQRPLRAAARGASGRSCSCPSSAARGPTRCRSSNRRAAATWRRSPAPPCASASRRRRR